MHLACAHSNQACTHAIPQNTTTRGGQATLHSSNRIWLYLIAREGENGEATVLVLFVPPHELFVTTVCLHS